MIRRIALTFVVASAAVVLAPSLMAGEPTNGSLKSTACPSTERSGYIVASS